MKNRLAAMVLTIPLLAGFSATTTSAQSLLNQMRIGSCVNRNGDDAKTFKPDPKSRKSQEEQLFEHLVGLEQKRGLVLDVRPFAINQSTGKLSFSGNNGRVTVVNMNPFAYKYTISVAQHELVSSALTDFIDLLLPAKLRPTGRTQSGGAENLTEKNAKNDQNTRIGRILSRLNDLKCNDAEEGCKALKTLRQLVDNLQPKLGTLKAPPEPAAFDEYRDNLSAVRNEEADAYAVCDSATTMRDDLRRFFADENGLDELRKADEALTTAERLAQDLRELIDEYKKDADIKDYKARCSGFKCLDQFAAYSTEAATILDSFRVDVDAQLRIAKEMHDTLDATNAMTNKEGLFARTFAIIKRFEFTEATVSVVRTNRANTNAENVASATGAASAPGKTLKPLVKGGSAPGGSNDGPDNDDGVTKEEDKSNDENDSANNKAAATGNGGNGGTGGNSGNALTNQSTQSIQIGRARFLLSGGLVFSPMQRRNFQPVTGFAHDASGNPTGKGNDNVIGLAEDSPRRLLPMAILNTRVHSFEPTSFYLSLGVTAKHDDNVDIEYLLGPSVSLLNERALFTFGGYVGKVQNLVPDVRVGDKIPASAGDAKLYTKRYSWKPGFSFSYVFSESKKQSESLAGGGGGTRNSASQTSDLKNEIRIGGIPFSLAMGLVYSSLEDQTYDEILGFARDRQGNLTNGQNLTRIAGLVSDSDYRLIPMAMLHTRLLNFGSRSLYFTTGVSGRKVDNNVKIEYLLGPSVNLYRRKLFFTFGAFAGKRQVLGGDFFPGAALDKDQSVTTHDRYIWKPAFGFSYDVSRIFRRDSQ